MGCLVSTGGGGGEPPDPVQTDSHNQSVRSNSQNDNDSGRKAGEQNQEKQLELRNKPHTAADGAPRPSPLIPHNSHSFSRFSFEQLAMATNNFSRKSVISEGGPDGSNVVYKGMLADGRVVAVKKLHRKEWQDEDLFLAEAEKVGKLRYSGLVPLVGLCTIESKRFLVSEYMPKSTLSQHLFHYEKRPMSFGGRMNVALVVAKTLQLLFKEGLLYPDLNAYRIFYDAELQPRLSCFGLMKSQEQGGSSINLAHVPPEFLTSGSRRVTPESVVYSYGLLLLALLSGKTIMPKQFLELVQGKGKSTVDVIVDSALLERRGTEGAVELVPLVADCLKTAPEERPSLSKLISVLEALETRAKTDPIKSSPENSPPVSGDAPLALPPRFAQAAASCDFKKLHVLLVKEMYGTPPQETF